MIMERLFWIAKNILGGVVGPIRSANTVLAGPTSGPAANPAFRALTLTDIGFASENANTVFAGPTSGGAAAPTFRGLVSADIPTLTTAKLSDALFNQTWTPNDASGAGLSLTITAANYTQIGGLNISSYDITYPSTANGSGVAVGGLPGTSHTSNIFNFPCMLGLASTTTFFMSVTSTPTMQLFNENLQTQQTNAQISATRLRGVVLYF